ncbi:MAG: hypothetical protein IJD64_01140 [Clostridia bacterium]|nr:hypothetical protein [Clostridia bacterium]
MEYTKRYFISKFKHNVQARILFQYFFLTLICVIIGLFLARSASLSFLGEQAIRHFALPFTHCSSFREVFWEFFHYFCSDLICIILLLLSAFSLLNCFFSDIVLAFLGLRLGVTTAMCFSLRNIGYDSERWGLFLLRLAITISFVFCAYHLSHLSYEFGKKSNQGRVSLFPKLTVMLLGIALALTSIILVFNILYCGFIFLI